MLLERSRDHKRHVHTYPRTSSAAPFVGVAIGVFGIGLGCYVLVRAGINTNDLRTPTVEAFHVKHTPLLALSEIGFGVALILAAMISPFGQVAIGLLCGALIAFGAALLSAAPDSGLHRAFGMPEHQGLMPVVVGAVGLLAILAFPTGRRRTRADRRPAADRMTTPEPTAAPGELELAPNPEAACLSDTAEEATPLPGFAIPVSVDAGSETPVLGTRSPCLSDCDDTFDSREPAEGDIRFCGLGHAQRWHADAWELVETDTDHDGLRRRVVVYQ